MQLTTLPLLGRDDPGWDAARAAFNLAVDQRPAFVARPGTVADVRETVRWAADRGLRVVAQRTGHGAAALGDLGDAVLVRTDALGGVTVDAERRTVRAGAGALWADVIPPVSAAGLSALHGAVAGLGVVGYSLAGGVGWYARSRGLQVNSVTAVELVAADGALVRADAEHEPELFWALRGGGAGFGVVTAIEFDLHAIGEAHGGALLFGIERAEEVLHAWRAWAADAPEEATTIARLLRMPDADGVPEPMRGGAFTMIEGVVAGEADTAGTVLGPLRGLGPAVDTFAPVDAVRHTELPDPVPYLRGDALLGELDAGAVDAVLELAGPGATTPLTAIELRHVGGAAARTPAHAGAVGALDAEAIAVGVGMLAGGADAAGRDLTADALDEFDARLAPHATARRSANFADTPLPASAFYDAATAERLRRIRHEVDPDGLFVARIGGEEGR